MKRINKVLILFLFLIALSFGATWEVLQSNWVAQKVSKLATFYIEKNFDAKVEFTNLQFSLLPPGAEIKNLQLNGKQGAISFNIQSSEVGFYFNPVNIFETNFKVNKITLKDSLVSISEEHIITKKNNQSEESINLDILDKLYLVPVNIVDVQDLKLSYNKFKLQLKEIQLENKKEKLGLKADLRNLNIGNYQKYISKVDSLRINSELSRDRIDINSIKILSGVSSGEFSGFIKNYVSSNIRYNLKGTGNVPIASVHEWLSFEEIGKIHNGLVESHFEITGKGSDLEVLSQLVVTDFQTDFINGDKVDLNLRLKNNKIFFENLRYEDQEASIVLVKPFEFYNINTNKFVEQQVVANLQSVKTNKILTYLGPSLELIKGELNGEVTFDLYSNGFKIESSKPILVNNFKLQPSDKLEIFEIEKLQFSKARVVYLDNDVRLEFNSQQGNSNLDIIGKITRESLVIKIPETFIDYEIFKHVMDKNIKGKGLLGIQLENKMDFLNVALKTDIKKFEIEGYRLEKFQSSVDINLDKGNILINSLKGSSGKSIVSAQGNLNYKESKINADYKITNIDLTQIRESLIPLFESIDLKGNEVIGLFNSTGKISGEPSLNGVKVSGELSSNTVFVYDESLENVQSTYTFNNQVFYLPDFKASRSKGNITADFLYSLKTKNYELNTLLKNVGIQDFNYYSKLPLALRAVMNGRLKVGEVDGEFYFKTNMSLSKTNVYSKEYPDSYIELNWDKENLVGDINIFAKTLWSQFQISNASKEISNLKLGLNINDIKDFLGVFTTTNVLNIDLNGSINYFIDLKFDGENMKIYDLKSNLSKFVLKKGIIDVNYINNKEEVIVENGVVKFWKMNARGKGFYLLSSGDGNLLNTFNSETFVKIDATILEIFNDVIQSSNGNLRGKLIYGQNESQQIYSAFLTSNNLALNSKLLPTSISNTDTFISFKDKKINIERFNSELATGTLKINGDIDFQNVIPNININYVFNDAGLIILNKSNLIFSGAGKIIGKQFPYAITGNMQIEKFNIINEPTEFGLGSSGFQQKEIEFLPGARLSAKDQLVNFNINVVTNEPIYIRNSIADVGLVASIQLLGGEKDPRVSGMAQLAPRNNKITFKNNDFVFSKGEINFVETESITNPLVDFNANSQISDYKINVSVVGPVKNFNLNLSSEPALEQTDILSLIAFGYTEDLSNNLSDSEKESMTRAGVGSILFDSFKINETLKNEFGVQVNLGTEISQDETSYLAGRSSEGSSSVGRVRSATTFEVKKKLDDNVSMAVRSTVGTSTTQKQAINLNYDINNKLSVEGVYESKSIDDQESINNDTSFGADLKWKWSFK